MKCDMREWQKFEGYIIRFVAIIMVAGVAIACGFKNRRPVRRLMVL
jgi:hypothetical protein